MTDVFLALLRYTSQNEKSYPMSTLHQHQGALRKHVPGDQHERAEQ